MKKKLFLILFALLPMIVFAGAVEIDGIYYNLVSEVKTAEVTSGSFKYSGEIIIPEVVIFEGEEYRVTSIGDHAFAD